MDKTDKITPRQLAALIFVSMLSPIIRLFPRAAVLQAGHAGWLSVIPGAVAGVVHILIVTGLYMARFRGLGLLDLMCRSVGKFLGRAIAILCALWLIAYSGFLVRATAERLLSTLYQTGSPTPFFLVLLGAALLAASGPVRALGRTGEVFALIIIPVLAAALLFSTAQFDVKNLLPVTANDAVPILKGSLPVMDIFGLHLFFYFLAGHIENNHDLKKQALKWFALSIGAVFLITLTTIGAFNTELIVNEQHAFFTLVKNIEILGVIERVEALVITLWIITDFALVASMLMISGEIFKNSFGLKKRASATVPAAVLSGAFAFFMVNSAFSLVPWSDTIVPAVNISITFLIIPAIILIGLVRKKI